MSKSTSYRLHDDSYLVVITPSNDGKVAINDFSDKLKEDESYSYEIEVCKMNLITDYNGDEKIDASDLTHDLKYNYRKEFIENGEPVYIEKKLGPVVHPYFRDMDEDLVVDQIDELTDLDITNDGRWTQGKPLQLTLKIPEVILNNITHDFYKLRVYIRAFSNIEDDKTLDFWYKSKENSFVKPIIDQDSVGVQGFTLNLKDCDLTDSEISIIASYTGKEKISFTFPWVDIELYNSVIDFSDESTNDPKVDLEDARLSQDYLTYSLSSLSIKSRNNNYKFFTGETTTEEEASEQKEKNSNLNDYLESIDNSDINKEYLIKDYFDHQLGSVFQIGVSDNDKNGGVDFEQLMSKESSAYFHKVIKWFNVTMIPFNAEYHDPELHKTDVDDYGFTLPKGEFLLKIEYPEAELDSKGEYINGFRFFANDDDGEHPVDVTSNEVNFLPNSVEGAEYLKIPNSFHSMYGIAYPGAEFLPESTLKMALYFKHPTEEEEDVDEADLILIGKDTIKISALSNMAIEDARGYTPVESTTFTCPKDKQTFTTSVVVHNQQLVAQHNLLTYSGKAMPMNFGVTYRSGAGRYFDKCRNASLLGPGWRFNFEKHIYLTNYRTFPVFCDETGDTRPLISIDANYKLGSVYTEYEDGDNTKTEHIGYCLTYSDGIKEYYLNREHSSAGGDIIRNSSSLYQLHLVKDRFGNKITYSYDSQTGVLDTITDDRGFEWTVTCATDADGDVRVQSITSDIKEFTFTYNSDKSLKSTSSESTVSFTYKDNNPSLLNGIFLDGVGLSNRKRLINYSNDLTGAVESIINENDFIVAQYSQNDLGDINTIDSNGLSRTYTFKEFPPNLPESITEKREGSEGDVLTSFVYDSTRHFRLTNVNRTIGLSETYTYFNPPSSYRVNAEYYNSRSEVLKEECYSKEGIVVADGSISEIYANSIEDNTISKISYSDGTSKTFTYEGFSATTPFLKLKDYTGRDGYKVTVDSHDQYKPKKVTAADNLFIENTYETDGRLSTVKGKDGNTATYSYNSLTDSVTINNLTTTHKYEQDGRIKTITLPGSKVTDYDYYSNGQIKSITYPAIGELTTRKKTSYTYRSDGNLDTITTFIPSQEGTSTTSITTFSDYNAYNQPGKKTIKLSSGKNISSEEYKYFSNGAIEKVVYNNDNMDYIAYTYDNLGRVKTVYKKSGNKGKKQIYEYELNQVKIYSNYDGDGLGNILESTTSYDSYLRIKEINYHTTNRVVNYVWSNKGVTDITVKSGGVVIDSTHINYDSYTQKTVTRNGIKQVIKIDDSKRTLSTSGLNLPTTVATQSKYGPIQSISIGTGYELNSTFDSYGNRVNSIPNHNNSGGHYSTSSSCPLGVPMSTTYPGLDQIDYDVNANGTVTGYDDGTKKTKVTGDAYGNENTVVDGTRSTNYTSDLYSRKVEIKRSGSLTGAVKDETTTRLYNRNGQLTEETIGGVTEKITYDAKGRVDERTLRNGNKLIFKYNSDDTIDKILVNGVTAREFSNYNEFKIAETIKEVNDDSTSYTITRDYGNGNNQANNDGKHGKLVKIGKSLNDPLAIEKTYNVLGGIKTIKHPGGELFTYKYWNQMFLESIKVSDSSLLNLVYNVLDKDYNVPIEKTVGSLITKYGYLNKELGIVNKIEKVKQGEDNVNIATFTHYGNGLKKEHTQWNSSKITYTYDTENRLEVATGGPLGDDDLGDKDSFEHLSSSIIAGENLTYMHGCLNEYVSFQTSEELLNKSASIVDPKVGYLAYPTMETVTSAYDFSNGTTSDLPEEYRLELGSPYDLTKGYGWNLDLSSNISSEGTFTEASAIWEHDVASNGNYLIALEFAAGINSDDTIDALTLEQTSLNSDSTAGGDYQAIISVDDGKITMTTGRNYTVRSLAFGLVEQELTPDASAIDVTTSEVATYLVQVTITDGADSNTDYNLSVADKLFAHDSSVTTPRPTYTGGAWSSLPFIPGQPYIWAFFVDSTEVNGVPTISFDAGTDIINSIVIAKCPSVKGEPTLINTGYTLKYEGGRVVEDSRFNYQWDAFNRITKATAKVSVVSGEYPGYVTYNYDGLGRRIKATFEDGRTLDYLYDGINIVGIEDSDGPNKYFYYEGVNRLYAMKIVGGTKAGYYTCITDDRGTLIGIADSDGNIVEKIYYNATGLCEAHSEVSDGVWEKTANMSQYAPFGWTGLYLDDYTGKYHAHYRDYSPIHARWLSEDPAGYADGLNLYAAYMGVNGRDPSGLMTTKEYESIIKFVTKQRDNAVENWKNQNASIIKKWEGKWIWRWRHDEWRKDHAGLMSIRYKYGGLLHDLNANKNFNKRVEAVHNFYADLCNLYNHGNDTNKWDLELYIHNWDDTDPAQEIHGALYTQTRDLAIEAATVGAGKIFSIVKRLPAASLSNFATRNWYVRNVRSIGQKLPKHLPLKQRAIKAFKMRTNIRVEARRLMKDRTLANSLPKMKTLDELIKYKKAKGLVGDDIWKDIIRSSQTANESVNKFFGIK